MMKRKFFLFLLSVVSTQCSIVSVSAQSASTSVFDFLNLPSSAHSMSLGGYNISAPDDDASNFFQNPALMSNANDKSISLNFFTYMQGSKAGSVAWTMAHKARGTWGVGAQFVGYGSMQERSITGAEMGSFSALDMCISGGYSYLLSERWAGGAIGKFIYSGYGSYNSIALAVDLGINYYHEEKGFSASFVAANLGGQVKAFGNISEAIPYDLRIGFTQRLAKAPIRFSVTMTDLTRWSKTDYYSATGNVKGGQILLNHFVVGLDVIPMKQFYVAIGYNFRRAYEMKAAGGSHAAGLCIGGGLNIKKFKFDFSYAKYHLSVPSFMFTAQYSL